MLHMLEMAELTLWQDVVLKVRDLQVRFDAFEADSRMSDCLVTEIDEELEEGRVSLEKLDKRVRELETDLPELIAEKVATLKTENAELRHNLNLVIDAVNNITKIWNEALDEQSTEDTPQQSQQQQLTLEEVYNKYQSQPRDEEGWEEMTNEIEAANKYEASLPVRTNGLTQEEWNNLLKI